MPVPLLNADQQRRLTTHLRLLADDLDAVRALPELSAGDAATARVRRLADEALGLVRETRDALALPAERGGPTLARRVAAVAGVWAARVEDLRARRLKGYGAVHDGLAELLDPRIDRLRRVLEALAVAAADLPDGEDAC